MKKIYIFSLIAFLICPFSGFIFGQENINSTVEVKREFEGKLLEIAKSPLDTKYSDTLMKFNLKFDYSTFDRPYTDLYDFSPMESVSLSRKGLIRYPVFYTKIALSYPWMPEADIYVQPRFGNRFSMLFYANHASFFGHKKGDILSPVDRMKNRGGVFGSYVWNRGELTFDASFSNNQYGLLIDGDDSLSRVFDNVKGEVRVLSVNPDPTSFYYDAKISYLHTSDRYNIPFSSLYTNENNFSADVALGMTIARRHKVLLELESNTVSSGNIDKSGVYGNFVITPRYKYENGRWRLTAGVSFAGAYGALFSENGTVANVYPNINVGFEAVRNSLWIYSVIDGENSLISYSDALRRNPWVSYSNLGNYSIPIRAELGLRGVAGDKFSYSVSGLYAHYDRYLNFYSNAGIQSVLPLYNIDEIYAKGEVLFQTEAVSFGGTFKYEYFFDTKVCMVPDFSVSAFAQYNYRKRIFVEMKVNYLSDMFSYNDTGIFVEPSLAVKGFVDLGAVVTYAINSKFSVFAQGNNLLNQKIQYVHRYFDPGINFGLGLFLKL